MGTRGRKTANKEEGWEGEKRGTQFRRGARERM